MAMETRKIGSLDVSVVGLGTNNFGFRMDEADVPAVVDAALDAGITFFDTADSYGRSERRLAKALGARREDVVLATEFASPLGSDRPGGARPEHVRSAVERSLWPSPGSSPSPRSPRSSPVRPRPPRRGPTPPRPGGSRPRRSPRWTG
jgi:diketogulonate reductase-like aldo/keto reductase